MYVLWISISQPFSSFLCVVGKYPFLSFLTLILTLCFVKKGDGLLLLLPLWRVLSFLGVAQTTHNYYHIWYVDLNLSIFSNAVNFLYYFLFICDIFCLLLLSSVISTTSSMFYNYDRSHLWVLQIFYIFII